MKQTLYSLAAKYGIKFYRLSINSNHIHSLLRMTNHRLFASFLREVSGKTAMKVVGSAKGRAAGEKFWMVPFTRIVQWGAAYLKACRYVEMNVLESTGSIPHTPHVSRGKGKAARARPGRPFDAKAKE